MKNPPASFTWSSHVAGSIQPKPGLEAWYLGFEVDGRAVNDDGARWTVGPQFGVARAPKPERLATGFALHADVGSEFRQGALFDEGNYYLGGTGELTVWAGRDRYGTDRNEGTWLVRAVGHAVLFARYRGYNLGSCAARQGSCWQHSFGLGAAFRLTFLTEVM